MHFFKDRKNTLLAIGLTLALSGCLGSGIKRLGQQSGSGTTNTNGQEAFSVTLAFRDVTVATNRVVAIQGPLSPASANFVNVCGTTGSGCTCDFFTASGSTTATASSATGFSQTNNAFSCTISGAVAPATFTHVRFRSTTDTTKTTGFIPIKTALTLEDVLAGLDKNKVRKVFSYSCQRSFFEGEGVNSSANQINCVADQRLGLIKASYDFYIYQGGAAGEDNNSGNKLNQVAFASSICGFQGALKIDCGTLASNPSYGLFSESSSPFTVGVDLASAPELPAGATKPIKETVGFGVLPDGSGNCPTGLTKIRLFRASPASMVVGAPLGCGGANLTLPTTFINSGGVLDNVRIELASSALANLEVTQIQNTTACSNVASATNCSGAVIGNACASPVQSVAYVAQTPVVCAIPGSLLQ